MTTGKVNQRIKSFIEQRGLTLDELSDQTGIDKSYLASIEDGNVHPPLGPMLKIARALGVRLGTFLDDQETKDPLVIRKKEREEEFSVLPGKSKKAGHRFFSLGKGRTDRHMEPFYVEIHPGQTEDVKLSSHEGEEFIVVVSGAVDVTYGKDVRHLEKGDSIYYSSLVPHYVSCSGKTAASIYAVLYIPE